MKVTRVSNLVFLCIAYEFCATFMPKHISNMVFSLTHGPDVEFCEEGTGPLIPSAVEDAGRLHPSGAVAPRPGSSAGMCWPQVFQARDSIFRSPGLVTSIA